MTGVVVSKHVAAPVERVWALATDLERSPEMLRGVDRVEVRSPPPFAVGTRWRETRTMLGKSATEEMWVSAVEPERSYTVEAESHGTHYVSTFEFRPAGEASTELVLHFEGRPVSGVAKVLGAVTAPLAKRSVAKALQGDLDDIAAAAERG